MRAMRIAVLIVALPVVAMTGASAQSAARPAQSTVPCDEVILQTRFPYPNRGYRLVLGVVSVPPAYMPQVVATGRRPWSYWRKAGLIIRADRPSVSVSVAKSWQKRAAIRWGWSAGAVSSLRFAACSSRYELRDTDRRGRPKMGNAYSGGFYLRSAAACVPLIFRVGNRTETVRFGVGRRCPAG
jgi:hypothetical protein